MNMPHSALGIAKEWAKERLRSGAEPPWTYYRLMQLIDAVDALTAGEAVVSPTGCLQQSARPQDDSLPQGGKIYRLDTARSRRNEPPIQLPT